MLFRSWDQVKLLTVQINRLERWHRPGLLCIGDAAHAMSPAFGVGVNFAIQDAVAVANAFIPSLRIGVAPDEIGAAVQSRRMPPVVRMQKLQLRVHSRMAQSGGKPLLPTPVPWYTRAALRIAMPILRRVSARVIGRGFRPEHLRDADREPPGA